MRRFYFAADGFKYADGRLGVRASKVNSKNKGSSDWDTRLRERIVVRFEDAK
jgi:hypothetical protein